jgi:hypothetical protein
MDKVQSLVGKHADVDYSNDFKKITSSYSSMMSVTYACLFSPNNEDTTVADLDASKT